MKEEREWENEGERRMGKGECKEQREGEGKSYFHLQYIVYCSMRRDTHFLRSTPGAGAAHVVRVGCGAQHPARVQLGSA